MGFSKGAYAAAIAMALEPQIPAAWLDSAPFHGLRGSGLAPESREWHEVEIERERRKENNRE